MAKTRTVQEALIDRCLSQQRVMLKYDSWHGYWGHGAVEITSRRRIKNGVRLTASNGEQYDVVITKVQK